MKLQPFFLFLSLLLFILSSCEQAEKSRSYQLVRSDQTLAFTLDDKTKNVTPFLSYYRDKKGKEYICSIEDISRQDLTNYLTPCSPVAINSIFMIRIVKN